MRVFQFDEKPVVGLSQTTEKFLSEAETYSLSVLCGRNNCGKSYILKTLAERIGEAASYLGPARYQNFTILAPYQPQRGRKRRIQEHQNFISNWHNQSQNVDNSPRNLQSAIAEMSDADRAILIEIMEVLLGVKMEIRHTVDDNEMSNKYVSVDGHNISFTSSGYRLTASLITSLLDKEYQVYLIDEPELGISPEVQGIIADFLFDSKNRTKYFAHIKSLVLATHSTIFLDRKNFRTNYFVEKNQDEIVMTRASSPAEINKIHFFLLGNRLEHLYLPSSIVIVEGKTDHQFIERALITRFPDNQISVVSANTDNRVKEVLKMAQSLLGDIQKGPFRNRVFVILDSRHQTSLIDQLERMGLPKEQIIVWSQNGIEHCYPRQILQHIFGAEGPISISGDVVEINAVRKTKSDLADEVVARLTKDSQFPEEFECRFLSKISETIEHPTL